jgi:glycerol kinase
MQIQADLAGRRVVRAETAELSALGVARLAGLQANLWSWADLTRMVCDDHRFEPRMNETERKSRRRVWHQAVVRARRDSGTKVDPSSNAENA